MCISTVKGNNWEGMTSIHKSGQTGERLNATTTTRLCWYWARCSVHRL